MSIKLQESGYSTGMSFEEFCKAAAKHGDNPADYSTNENDFVFVSPDYAASDSHWGKAPEGWPENLPVWEYRPC